MSKPQRYRQLISTELSASRLLKSQLMPKPHMPKRHPRLWKFALAADRLSRGDGNEFNNNNRQLTQSRQQRQFTRRGVAPGPPFNRIKALR
jgi:hypothetical protein